MNYVYYIFTDITKLDGGEIGLIINITNSLGKEILSERGVFLDNNEYEKFATSDECGHKMLQSGVKAFLTNKYPSRKIKNLLEQTKDLRFYAYKQENSFYVDLASRYKNLSTDRDKHWAFIKRVGEHNTKIQEEVMNALITNDSTDLKLFITDIFKVSLSNINNIEESLPMFKFTINVLDINVQSNINFSELIKIEIIEFN